jgi:hypothetical protein
VEQYFIGRNKQNSIKKWIINEYNANFSLQFQVSKVISKESTAEEPEELNLSNVSNDQNQEYSVNLSQNKNKLRNCGARETGFEPPLQEIAY